MQEQDSGARERVLYQPGGQRHGNRCIRINEWRILFGVTIVSHCGTVFNFWIMTIAVSLVGGFREDAAAWKDHPFLNESRYSIHKIVFQHSLILCGVEGFQRRRWHITGSTSSRNNFINPLPRLATVAPSPPGFNLVIYDDTGTESRIHFTNSIDDPAWRTSWNGLSLISSPPHNI